MYIPERLDGIDINPKNPLGSYLRGLREYNLLSRSECAQRYGMLLLTLTKMESGFSVPQYATLRKIANIYGIPHTRLGMLRRAAAEIKRERQLAKRNVSED